MNEVEALASIAKSLANIEASLLWIRLCVILLTGICFGAALPWSRK